MSETSGLMYDANNLMPNAKNRHSTLRSSRKKPTAPAADETPGLPISEAPIPREPIPEDLIGDYRIRRILAERKKSKVSEYLVEWYPSWSTRGQLGETHRVHLDNWKELKDNKQAFLFTAIDKIELHYLADSVDSENHSDESVTTMVEEATKHLKSLNFWEELLNSGRDWIYATKFEELRAKRLCEKKGEGSLISLQAMFRQTYQEIGTQKGKNLERLKLTYGNINLRYVGKIEEETAVPVSPLKRQKWTVRDVFGRIYVETIENEDDWVDRKREYLIQMYRDEVGDERTAHDILETYDTIKDICRRYKTEADEEAGRGEYQDSDDRDGDEDQEMQDVDERDEEDRAERLSISGNSHVPGIARTLERAPQTSVPPEDGCDYDSSPRFRPINWKL
ncbi:hypothetical protein BCR34DRAFT_604391 [Clohesyomyces aquaticus]|uniref:Uncharacterized protein n=1 Tax=Clohesyomyces aquaticus TaxID=1231657 RepID=A0A1Y1Z6D1_9PLEO|nr:hypothetical protein BCR34DRAFT_604391 [Clohesyomyces aquaticus]